MNIIVCLKQVPDTNEVRINQETGTLIRDGVPSIINPDDKNGLEEALRLRDEFGGKVTVISMGPPQAKEALREAVAMGADEVYLVSDRAFGGSDTWATATVLTAAIEKIRNYDLIICGRQAIDGDTAQVGPQIAEHLGLPQVSYVKEMQYDEKDNSLTIKRVVEDGYYLVNVQLPALVTVLTEANAPRYMRVKGIVEAFDREIETWTFDNIEINPEIIGLKGSPTKVKKSFTKGAKQAGKVFELDTKEAVELIVEKLKEKFE